MLPLCKRGLVTTFWALLMFLGGLNVSAQSFKMNEQMVEQENSRIQTWREAFRRATEKRSQRAFLHLMEQHERDHPSDQTHGRMDAAEQPLQAYLAVAHLLVDSHRRNVFAKWRSFKHWTGRLDRAVRSFPAHPEIRFLRLTTQNNAPDFLGYAGQLSEDCAVVAKALQSGYWEEDPAHQDFIVTVIRSIPKCPQTS